MRSLRSLALPLLLFIGLSVAGLSARFPLLSNLSVEFALVCAVPLFFAGLWLGGVVARRTSAWAPAERFLAVFFPGSFSVVAVSLFPLLLGYTVSPDIQVCGRSLSLVLYTFFAGGAALTGFYWGLAGSLFFARPFSRFLLFTLLVILTIAYSVADIAWGARITPLNPIFGILVFYGVNSAEDIPDVAWNHRAFYLLLSLSLVALGIAFRSRHPDDRLARSVLLAFFGPLLVALIAVGLVRRDSGGFLPGTLRLSEYLPEMVESEHIRLFYDPGSVRAENVLRVLGTLEWAYRKNARVVPPLSGHKIHAYYYNASLKEQLTGAEVVLFATPARSSIHITGTGDYVLLRHELAHTMMAPYGLPIIRVPLSLPMVEGVADAISHDYGVSLAAHSYIAAALKNGDLPSAASIMTNAGFLKLHSRLAYAFAGSFVGFLIQKYGAGPVLASYGGKRLAHAIGKPLTELDREWRAFLATVPVLPEQLKIARDSYNPRTAKPFYSTLCPRDRIRQKVRLDFLIGSNRLDEAEALLRPYTAREPDDPLWRSFFVRIAMARRQFPEAERLLQEMENDGMPSSDLIAEWSKLLRIYEQDWFNHPDSSQALANVKRALKAINALVVSGRSSLVYDLQIQVLETTADPSLYRAVWRYCSPRSRDALLRWASDKNALSIQVLFLTCDPYGYSLDDFRQLREPVEKANHPGLMRTYIEALRDWVVFRSSETQYDDIIQGYQLLFSVSPPSDRARYEVELDLLRFLREWRHESRVEFAFDPIG